MKKTNVKMAILLSVLSLSACDKGKGSKSNPISVPGVTLKSYNNIVPGQICNVNGDNTYSCSENGRSIGNISFDSLNTFCNVLSNEQANGYVAGATRQIMYQEQCSALVNNGFNNGFNPGFNNGFNPGFNNGFNPGLNNGLPQTSVSTDPNMRNVICQLYVEKDGLIGDTGQMNVQVLQNNKSGVNIFAYTNRQIQKQFLGIFNVYGNVASTSEKLAKVKMYYTKDTNKADMIKLEAKGLDGQINASVTGFAGSEVKLDIAPQDQYADSAKLSISCKSISPATTGTAQAFNNYRCKGIEKDGKTVTQIDYFKPYNEGLMGETYTLGKTSRVTTEGALATDEGSVIYEQIARYSTDSSITTRANVTTPSAISIQRPNYSLNVECKPTL